MKYHYFMISKEEYKQPWMSKRVAEQVMADTYGYSFGNWVKLGYIQMDKSLNVGRGNERKYSLKNCIQISAMKFLVDSGEQAKTAAILSLKVAELGEKYIDRLNGDLFDDGQSLFDQVMFWSGDAQKTEGINKLVLAEGTIKQYIKVINNPNKRISKNLQLKTRHSMLEAGYIIVKGIEQYYEVRNQRS